MLSKRNGRATTPLPPLATASRTLAPAIVAGSLMTAPSFALGHASDALTSITCPDHKIIAFTGRELRRAKEREQKRQQRQAAKRAHVIK